MSKETEQTNAEGDSVTEIDLTATETNGNGNNKTSTAVKLLLFILIAGLIAVSAAMFYFVKQGVQQLSSIQTDVQADIDSKLAVIDSLQEQLAQQSESSQEINNKINTLESAQAGLEQTLEALSIEKPNSNLEWGLAEVEHLLVVAIQKLQLANDAQTAIAALESANTRLADLADPNLLAVRKQITDDINKLRAVNQVDTAGMSLYLSDLISKVNTLPLKDSVAEAVEQGLENASTGTSSQGSQQNKFSNLISMVWQELKSMVVIKRKDETTEAFLLPNQEYYLYQNLQLQLQNARLAVLIADTANLHSSVDIVTDWLEQHFKSNDAAVGNVIDALNQMKTVELQPDLPDINSSLETLRAVIRSYQQDDLY